jgi:hypothetical protein
MNDHWVESGWTLPCPSVYRWLWLWDSCFHALIWDALDDDRAEVELASVLAAQTTTGFVPHMNYSSRPGAATELWGMPAASTITQPPLYGHVVAALLSRGRAVGHLAGPARAAILRLAETRRTSTGLLRIVHPWESGIDDSPRWARWQPEPWNRRQWADTKIALVRRLNVVNGEAVANPDFAVCPASFNALVAWNARQLGAALHDRKLLEVASELSTALDGRWSDDLLTWADVDAEGRVTSWARTMDSLLPALVTSRPERADAALASLLDPNAYLRPFGPAGVHPRDPAYDPGAYWRGTAWPPLMYLFWAAARQRRHPTQTERLADLLAEAVDRSGFAESWNPETGDGVGAQPQAWAGLTVVCSPADEPYRDRR